MTARKRLLVIGLDGATFDIIKPNLHRLPTLRKLIEGGTHGTLRSTIPPVTIPAWPAMFTGKNPGKIGVFSLLRQEQAADGSIKFNSVNSSDFDGKRVWSYLTDAGLSSAIINVPATFPPDKVKGFMISGMGADVNGEYTYPKEMKAEIESIVKGYEISFYGFHRSGVKKFLGMLYERTEKRKKLVVELLKKKEWDFAFVVFTGTDTIQHYLWDSYDKSHPLHEDDGYGDSIPEFWQYMDKALDEIIKVAGDANVMIVSDHGFQGMEGRFNVNEWLLREGYLVLKERANAGRSSQVLPRLGITRERAKRLMWKLNLQKARRSVPGFIAERLESSLKNSGGETELDDMEIDWDRTVAYSFDYTGSIHIKRSLPEAERERLRKAIVRKMGGISNPLTGRRLKLKFFDTRKIYSGSHAGEAPDIMFFVEDLRYTTQVSIGHGDVVSGLDRSKPSNATHTMDGIFIACGPDIRKGLRIMDARIYDITPTALHMLGLAVPDDMDGKVLISMFRPGSGPRNEGIEFAKPQPEARRQKFEQSSWAEERMKQRLKELGYI